LYPAGQPVKFEQEQFRVRFTGLPATAPDPIATTIAVECDGEPTQDQQAIRKNRKREKV
jgi:alpha-L-fucosidase